MQVTRDRMERPRGALLQPDIECWYSLYRIGRSLETGAPASVEASVGYYPGCIDLQPAALIGRGDSVGGQFDWGGRLLKGNGGAQRFPQNGWKSFAECKGTRELDCETYKSSRDESRA